MNAVWTIERTGHRRFPYRITIEQGGRLLLAVRAQSSWPGPGQQIFCLREQSLDSEESLEPLERVPIVHLGRVGRKLTVVLDRPTRKRCEFLVVAKPAPGGGRPREQVFFRTESGIRAHRSRTRLELLPGGPPLVVVVDTAERYPWRFPGATVRRRKLPVGDYAVLDDERPAAVVERKTFDNLLTEFGALQALHHQLEDLGSCDCPALVIEAEYGDFLNDARLRGRWPAPHAARVLAELAALHPRLPIVYAGNRRLANAWCQRFFQACVTRSAGPQLELVRETLARYDAAPRVQLDERIREVALRQLGIGFGIRELAERFEGVPVSRLRRVLDQLRQEALITRVGAGRGARWVPVEPSRSGGE